jgi:hypothetical protein
VDGGVDIVPNKPRSGRGKPKIRETTVAAEAFQKMPENCFESRSSNSQIHEMLRKYTPVLGCLNVIKLMKKAP